MTRAVCVGRAHLPLCALCLSIGGMALFPTKMDLARARGVARLCRCTHSPTPSPRTRTTHYAIKCDAHDLIRAHHT